MAPSLQFNLLGNPEISLNKTLIAKPKSGKGQAILYYLAVTGRPQPRAALATLLWGDVPDSVARTNLRKGLAGLRNWANAYPEIAALLAMDHQSVALGPVESYWVDVAEFEQQAGPTASEENLFRAVTLYQGDFLAGFYVRNAPDFETWAYAEQARLRELAIQAMRGLIDIQTAADDLAPAIVTNRRLLTLEPWREEAHRQLMRLLALDGQRSAALAQFELCRQALAEELAVEPAVETLALYKQIRDGSLGRGAREQGPPVPQTPAPPQLKVTHNLPPQANSFIGREEERAALNELIANPKARLITIVGPGGMGKTRLAMAVAEQQLPGDDESATGPLFPDGLYFVSLAPVSSAAYLVSAITESLNLTFYGTPESRGQLPNYFRDKAILLILDNFEHLLDGAGLLSEIVLAAPQSQLLVTSRERLNLQEEWVYELGGMVFPVDAEKPTAPIDALIQYSAIQLFEQRARQVQADFDLAADYESVVRICQLVNGMPLGLELAAAWVKLISCHEIAAEIEQNLDFLATSMRNVPERHRSLRAVFEHSWRLLSDEEKEVFKRLSVFRGGLTRQAAEQVVGASLPLLSALVDKSLLHLAGSGRYEIHELLRQYASEKLQQTPEESETIAAAHAHYYADFLHRRADDLAGERQLEVLNEMAADFDNLRAAWNWAVAHRDLQALQQSLESLYQYAEMRGQTSEFEQTFRQAAEQLAASEPEPEARQILLGRLLIRQAWLAERIGLFEQGLRAAEQGIAILRPIEQGVEPDLAHALNKKALSVYFIYGETERATQLAREALTLATDVNCIIEMAYAHNILGHLAEFQGEYARAGPLFEESIRLYRQIGERRGRAFSLNNWGRAAYALGDYAQAQTLIEEALAIRRDFADTIGIAYSMLDLGKLAIMQGRYEAAKSHIQKALKQVEELDEQDLLARCYHGMGMAAEAVKAYAQAEALYQKSLAIYREIGVKRAIPLTLNSLGRVAYEQGDYPLAQQRLEECLNACEESANRGERASALRNLGHVAVATERYSEARRYYTLALEILLETGSRPVALDLLLGWAALLTGSSKPASAEQTQAIELLVLVQLHPASEHQTRERAKNLLAQWSANLPPDDMTVARQRGQALALWDTVAALIGVPARKQDRRMWANAPLNNLPAQPTPFVGRKRELADIVRRLTDRDCRLLALTGPGGIGKTRLALQTAQTIIDATSDKGLFPDGILFVSLVAVNSVSSVVSAIAQAAAFNFYSSVPPEQQLLDYLSGKRMLIILDNFEHLLLSPSPADAGAPAPDSLALVADILAAAPQVKVLVTSREALNLQQAWFHPVEGLSFPAPEDDLAAIDGFDAIRLFVQSAQRARVTFSLQAERPHVIRICQLVSGMPLAIELAAAWLKMLPTAKIVAELERGLDILSTRVQNLPERHRSMRTVFEQSWQFLPDAEQQVMARFSIFKGTFSQEAAGQIAGASFMTLAALVEKSLLRVTEGGRYHLHELLRQFAYEKLAQDKAIEQETRRRHCAYYLGLLQARGHALLGPEQLQALDAIEQEIDNIRLAWDIAVQQNILDLIDQSLGSLYHFYYIRSRYREGFETFAAAVTHLQCQANAEQRLEQALVCHRLLSRQGIFYCLLGDFEAGGRQLQACLETALEPNDRALALNMLGTLARFQGNVSQATKLLNESLTLSQTINNLPGVADALSGLGDVGNTFGEFETGRQRAMACLTISRQIGQPDKIARALSLLGWCTNCLGSYGESRRYFEESLAICRTIGDKNGAALALGHIGWAAWCYGGDRLTEAIDYVRQALAIFREIGHRSHQAMSLGDLALIVTEAGEPESALSYAQEGLAIGKKMNNQDMVSYNLSGLGVAQAALGNYLAAGQYLIRALENAWGLHLTQFLLALFYYADMLIKESATLAGARQRQQQQFALELLTHVIAQPASWQAIRDRAEARKVQLETDLPPEMAATAISQANARTLETVVAQISQGKTMNDER